MRGGSVREWEKKLKRVFNRIDAELETEYGDRFQLRSKRPEAGQTSNPEADGIFNIGAVFSAGYGSEHGRGYIVKIEMSTLSRVPGEVREEIAGKVAARLRELLPQAFPERELEVARDSNVFKIIGDLRL